MSVSLSVNEEWADLLKIKQLHNSLTLEESINEGHIKEIKNAFENNPKKFMTKSQFKTLLEDVLKVAFKEEDFNIIFMKMDEKRNNVVDWDEFISRLLVELQQKDKVVLKEIWQTPLNGPPIFISSYHRHPITRIVFYPALTQDNSTSSTDGKYVTLSKDGTVNFWTTEFELEKTYFSETYGQRVNPTWVTDIICLPDVMMIATSSTERDLRFYDTMAGHFELRIVISSLEKAVTCMAYHKTTGYNKISYIFTGDMGGHIRIYSFGKGLIINGRENCELGSRGPFSFRLGDYVKVVRYEEIKKGKLPGLLITEYMDVHPCGEWVRQVAFFYSIKYFISCANSSENSLILRDMRASTKVEYNFHIPHGVSCFTVFEERYILATGGPDCVVRIWSAFVPNKASAILSGHSSAICALEFLRSAQHLLSISKDRCIKIWDVGEQNCVQTYTQLTSEIGDHSRLSVYFHHFTSKLVIGSAKIAIVHYGPTDDEKKSDGKTHTQAVTKALYNSLFKCLVTVGNDSTIRVWDIWTGQCSCLIADAHTQVEYGLKLTIEITAAAFDPISQQLLVTGARDGSLKVWNFNSGLCIRHMNIEKNCEVTSVLWLPSRILAVGWNRHITEFADLESSEPVMDQKRQGSFGSLWPTIPRCVNKFKGTSTLAGDFEGKPWETRHIEDITCAAFKLPHVLATASYNGELTLWRLETGQPYRRYHVANPTGRFAIDYKKKKKTQSHNGSFLSTPSRTSAQSATSTISSESRKRTGSSKSSRVTLLIPNLSRKSTLLKKYSKSVLSDGSVEDRFSVTSSIKQMKSFQKAMENRKKRLMAISLPPEQASLRPLAIHFLLFLQKRECLPNVGTLLIALGDGKIQVWSHGIKEREETSKQSNASKVNKDREDHSGQDNAFLGSFLATHSMGDYVVCMATDENNEFLFTGDTAGYMKVWLLKNYFVMSPPPKIIMPLYRLRFPFLLKDRLEGRAKRSVRDQPLPLLLSSFRAHLRAITFIEYVSEAKALISCSSDCSVRIWTLGGRYIGTLGQNRPWPKLEYGKEIGGTSFCIPPEISRVGSFTTMKVLTGANPERENTRLKGTSSRRDEVTEEDLQTRVYGQRANKDHPLGKYFRLPKRSVNIHLPPKLDLTYENFVPVYTHIICPGPEPLDKPNPQNLSTNII